MGFLKVSLEQVQANLKRFGLLDDRVRFLKGWFKDTLAQGSSIGSRLRLDGDLYESTMDTLVPLYSKVSPGGYVIRGTTITAGPAAGKAVDEFRQRNEITAEIKRVDWTGADGQVPR